MNGLERVFCENHQYADRIFYDTTAGQYYDRASDLYLTLNEVAAYGLPV